MQATGEELRQASRGYRFVLLGDVHPLTIGERWTVLGSVTKGRSVVVGGRLRDTWETTEVPHPLIQARRSPE